MTAITGAALVHRARRIVHRELMEAAELRLNDELAGYIRGLQKAEEVLEELLEDAAEQNFTKPLNPDPLRNTWQENRQSPSKRSFDPDSTST